MFGSIIAPLLLIAVIVYIVLLIKIKQQGNRPGASTSVAQIQLIFIAFASFLCLGTSVAIYHLSSDRWERPWQYITCRLTVTDGIMTNMVLQGWLLATHWYSR